MGTQIQKMGIGGKLVRATCPMRSSKDGGGRCVDTCALFVVDNKEKGFFHCALANQDMHKAMMRAAEVETKPQKAGY